MVSPGKFVLYSHAVPPLKAGAYLLQGTQEIAPNDYPTAPCEANIVVTSVRYKLPPDQILSTFPPANSEGAYESRLPQICIERRTTPWEREADPDDPTLPWVALVVIAEGEGQISAEVPVDQCVTPGIQLAGPNDVASGIYLSVPRTTVNKVFPTKNDLHLLAHVREVDLEDTELAMGDDDGFLAVVMANRLPQYDRIGCKPVRYTACLINLEGQLDALPPPTNPVLTFGATAEVYDIASHYLMSNAYSFDSPDRIAMGAVTPMTFETLDISSGNFDISNASMTPAADPDMVVRTGARGGPAIMEYSIEATASFVRPSMRVASGGAGNAHEWRTTTSTIENVALNAGSSDAAAAVRDAMKQGFRLPLHYSTAEKIYRFPILAHWSFTCDGAGSFESLMSDLDVGLLGTLPGPAARKKRPPCATPLAGTAPPEVPPPRLPPEVTETGHVGLAHTTRAGDDVRAWYRGPFVPSPTHRELGAAPGGMALAHTSDQLRSFVPDGREDLSLAVAFEIGRLLALSRPAVVGAMMAWRLEQFGAERARRFTQFAGQSIDLLEEILDGEMIGSLGPLIGRTLVLETADQSDAVFGRFRPPTDPGRTIDFLPDDVSGILSVGLAVDPAILSEMRLGRASAALDGPIVPMGETVRGADRFNHLTLNLTAEVQRLATDALAVQAQAIGRAGAAGRGVAPEEPDALDALISGLSAGRQREE